METYSFEPALDKISPYPGRAAYPELMWVDDAAHQMSATGNAEGRRPAVDMRLTQVGGVALRITQGIASEADDILYRVFHDGVPAQPDARSDSSSLGIVDGASELSQPSRNLLNDSNLFEWQK